MQVLYQEASATISSLVRVFVLNLMDDAQNAPGLAGVACTPSEACNSQAQSTAAPGPRERCHTSCPGCLLLARLATRQDSPEGYRRRANRCRKPAARMRCAHPPCAQSCTSTFTMTHPAMRWSAVSR